MLFLGCLQPEPEPPPDNESGSTDDDAGEIEDTVVYDGQGKGGIYPPRLRDSGGLPSPNVMPGQTPATRDAIVIGAPHGDFGGVPSAGQLSVLLDDGAGHAPPGVRPKAIVEDQHDSGCGVGHRFAWELSAGRRLGSALAYYTRNSGLSFHAYEGQIVTSVATAAGGSGRVLLYPGCYSCAIFPRPEGEDTITGSRFGASLAVGFFGDPNDPPQEKLIIGAPLAGDGLVAVLDEVSFRGWESGPGAVEGGFSGVRECQCEYGSTHCLPWSKTLGGSFADGEFGASLSVADFDCDGTDDLAVGAPGSVFQVQGGGQIVQAGAVYVFTSAPGQSFVGNTTLRQGALEVGGEPEDGDRFGEALIAGNFNGARMQHAGHSCFDLVVATPNEDGGIGEIQIFEGSPDGLTFLGPILRMDDFGLHAGEVGDRFGHALTAGDFNRDGFDDLVIAAPGDLPGGSLTIVPGSDLGLLLDKATTWTQEDGTDELGDQASWALSWTDGRVGGPRSDRSRILVIGVPGEDDGTGAVLTRRFSETQDGMLVLGGGDDWNLADFGGAASAGDRFGEVLMPARAMPMEPWEQ